ncbi:Na+/H+ antiporter NhaA [Microlunatus soli]|uniref:Na(+)/H(+) antiporter NhaA n=1 Tax=Microlunatus soli TaxID=630515 RepID=A0A1H1SYZ0_9ACTN|nr:Na+/H+ antiporter NhaA [Microlunatus soli]SDS53257.1 sodium/proton antiporter, NhaA family [Microlunatus soli]
MPDLPPLKDKLPKRRLFAAGAGRERRTVAEFLRDETVGGALMLAATVIALFWANLGHHSYEIFRTLHLGPLSLEHWAADGLLTIFFFVAGLELKRELTTGSLSRPADALVPIVAAVAGMAIPAAVYLAINLPTADGRPEGWAVPMATDIAFALAILAIVGRQLPASLRAFLLTLAIVDDLGAISVIAIIFTDSVNLLWLLGAAACVTLWWWLQRRRIDHWWIFLPLGVLAWICTLQSGVHATIAGVAVGLATRSRGDEVTSPAEAWEHRWRPISAAVAVPIFALLAAGVRVSGAGLLGLFREPLALGVVVALVAGKTIGVFGGAFLTARFTRAELAEDLRWSEVFSVAILAGVGFTVALLVSDLAFGTASAAAEQSKSAVLVGSLLAAVLATLSLSRRNRSRRRTRDPGPG